MTMLFSWTIYNYFDVLHVFYVAYYFCIKQCKYTNMHVDAPGFTRFIGTCHMPIRGIAHDQMMTSNGNILRVTGPLRGEFPGHRWIPLIKASEAGFGVFFALRLNKQLNKQSWRPWFEAPLGSLWRRRNDTCNLLLSLIHFGWQQCRTVI